jgi:hypothetical protein
VLQRRKARAAEAHRTRPLSLGEAGGVTGGVKGGATFTGDVTEPCATPRAQLSALLTAAAAVASASAETREACVRKVSLAARLPQELAEMPATGSLHDDKVAQVAQLFREEAQDAAEAAVAAIFFSGVLTPKTTLTHE